MTVNTGKLSRMAKTKRGYSREFTPQTKRRVRLEIDRIPPTLYDDLKAKATREGLSLRALTLRRWKEWLMLDTHVQTRAEAVAAARRDLLASVREMVRGADSYRPGYVAKDWLLDKLEALADPATETS